QVKRPGGIFYTPATGIWQTVWLEPVPTDSIQDILVVANAKTGKVTVKATFRGVVKEGVFSIGTEHGEVGEGSSVQVASVREISEDLLLNKPRLWTPEQPHLY